MPGSSEDKTKQTLAETVSFSSHVYGLDEIKRASYRFVDTMSVDITPCDDEIVCILNFVRSTNEDEAQKIVNDFKIEVLDQDLRRTIAEETKEVRNAILAYTFSKTGLQDSE
jgi:His-Xaa-Ser system protein HxsD